MNKNMNTHDRDRFSQTYFGGTLAGEQTKEELEQTLTPFKKKTILAFLLSLPQGARVLDVGCGKGKAFAIARAYRPDLVLVGIDGADLAGAMPAGVEYVRGDVETLGQYFAPESFDAAICQHVFEHLVYPTNCAVGILDMLKPSGKLFLETPNWTRLLVPFSQLYFYNDYTHVRPYTHNTLHRLFYDSGFSRVESASYSSVPFFPQKRDEQTKDAQATVSVSMKEKEKKNLSYQRSFVAKLLSRIVGVFLRDVLVAIATK
ncbi:MAG: class I SAM-dependent methyltransferase [bacterium]